VGQLLRDKRKQRRLTLREVSECMAERGERIPTSTLARVEQGKLDPGVRRLHFLLDFYDVSAELVAELVEMERLAAKPPTGMSLEELHRNGLEYWRRGDVAQGLAHLVALRTVDAGDTESLRMRQRTALAFASAASELGKPRLARHIVDELLCEPPDRMLLPGVLLLAGRLWHGRGSTEAALALVREAAHNIDHDDHEELACLLQEQAEMLFEAGRLSEAAEAAESVIAERQKLNDRQGELQARNLRDKARDASRHERHGSKVLS